MSKFKMLEYERGIGFTKEDGEWYAHQDVEIAGETYERGERIPSEYSADYKRSNGVKTYWNRIKDISEKTGKTIGQVRNDMGRAKEINRFYSEYKNVKLYEDGSLRDLNTGQYVEEDEFLRKMKEEYPHLLELDGSDRTAKIEEIKQDWWKS